MASDRMEEYDFSRRIDAYAGVNAALFGQVSRPQAMLVLSTALHDMGEEELSLSQSAAHCLAEFVAFAASATSTGDDVAMEDSAGGGGAREVAGLAQTLLLPHLKTALCTENLVVRRVSAPAGLAEERGSHL